MDNRAYIAECKSEIAAIVRNRDFWSKHISLLEQNGFQPTTDDVAWVKKHIDGLNKSIEWLEQHIAEIENP